MASSFTQREGFRHGVSMRLDSIRRKFHRHSDDASTQLPRRTRADFHIVNEGDLLQSRHTRDASTEMTTSTDNGAHDQSNQSVIHTRHPEQQSVYRSNRGSGSGGISVSSDLWSTAYREAIDSLGEDLDIAILMGSNAAQLFKELEEIDKDATQESAFVRGVAYLHSIQVPLERFKLALDLASPLSKLDPTAATAFGVVSSVTAIAISFATADLQFAKQIGEMLEQISYIDDCDTLGQRASRTDIHKTLVSIYQKILEFYKVAHEILTRRGVKLVMKMILETDRLPNIVQDFLKHADTLRKLVEKATWEVVEDIKAMLYESEIARWLGSDKLLLQSQYHARLQELRNDEACGFLLKDPAFIDWYRAPDSQWLALFGNMGCGKTVTVAFLVDELSQRNEHQLPQPKTCYYYCRDDQSGQASHIFSTLILELLEQLPGLKKTFFEWCKRNQVSGVFEPAKNTKLLSDFLETVLETLDRPVFIIIDGLDECDRASRKVLFKLLKTISQKSPRLKILLSSRPEEEISKQLDTVARIDLTSDTHRDALIVRHTVEMQLSYLSEDVRAQVIKTLSPLARGSAIWTKMVVELIEVRRISALGPMRLFLEEMPLPKQLSQLFVTMISRHSSDDPENKELITTALKLLAAVRRPLSIQELAWAVALAASQHDVTTIAVLAQSVDHERVMSLIHPFITRIDYSDVRKRQVRLVHHSVKEFITQGWQQRQNSTASAAADRKSQYQQTETLESFVLDLCIDYLLLYEIGSFHLFSEEQAAMTELPQDSDLFEDIDLSNYDPHCTWEIYEENMVRYDPSKRGFGHFFVYAARHWIEHLGSIQSGRLSRLAKIESLCQAGSVRLDNWVKQNCRPDCAILARFEFDSRLYDPLSIIALYGSESMLRDMLENSNFDENKFLLKPAFHAAHEILRWGDVSRLKLLFSEGRFSCQLQSFEIFRLMIEQWYKSSNSQRQWYDQRQRNWNMAFELVDYTLDAAVREQWGSDIFCMAARTGCMPMIQHLLNRAQHKTELRTELLRGFQSIGEAVWFNQVDVVKFLLEEENFEAHLRYVNSRGENVLHLASITCNPALFHLLVPRLQESVHQTDIQGDTALVRIIRSPADSEDRCESARILLLSPGYAAWDSHSRAEQHDALQTAVSRGDTEMCRLLIGDGKINPCSVLTRGEEGKLVLKDKPLRNEETILQLLETHASCS